MVLEFSLNKEFTPKWMGNAESDVPFVVKHKAPTVALFNQLIPKPTLKFTTGKDGEAEGGEVEVTIDNTKIVRNMVTEIVGLDLKNTTTGTIIKIQTAGDLFRDDVPAAISGLVDEIGQYLNTLLQKKTLDEKN